MVKVRFFVILSVLVASLTALPGVASGGSRVAALEAKPGAAGLLDSTGDGVEFEVLAPIDLLELGTIVADGTEYAQLSLPGWPVTHQAGSPELPYVLSTVGAPFGAQVRVEVEPGPAVRVALPARIKPVATVLAGWTPESLEGDAGAMPSPQRVLAEDAAVYGSAAGYPGLLAEVVSDGVMRQQRLVGIAAYPVQYEPATGELVVYERLLVRLTFEGGDGRAAKPWEESAAYGGLLSSSLLNPESAQAWARPSAAGRGPAAIPWVPPEPGYRVYVEEDGIYKITYGELDAAQVPLGTWDPHTLRMYAGGQEIAIHVEGEGDGIFDPDDYVLFYGQGVRSKYTTQNVYWLTFGGDPGLRMDSRDGTLAAGAVPPSYTARLRMEENNQHISILPGDEDLDRYVWGGYPNPPKVPAWSHTYSLPTLAEGDLTARLEIQMFGGNLENTAVDPHRTRVFVNGQLVEDAAWNGVIARPVTPIEFPQLYLNVGDNTVTVECPDSPDLVYIDWVALEYENVFTASQDSLPFGSDQAGIWTYTVDGFTTGDVLLFDVTSPAAVQRITGGSVAGSGSAFSFSFSDEILGATDYWAVAGTRFLSPQGIEEDTSSSLQSVANGADYILVTHADFSDAVQPLLTRRAAQGLRVAEVDVQDAYDEFGYGLTSAYAIRDFLKYAYENWQRPAPTYVVLVGDGHLDPNDYLGFGQPSFIPPYLAPVDPWIGETAADNRYVTFTEGDRLPEMSLGRLPVNSPAEATAIVDKTLSFEQDLASGGASQSVLFVSDDADRAGNFANLSEDLISCCLPGSYASDKVYYQVTHASASDARADIITGIDAGQFIVNYIGHAGVTGWATEALFSVPSLASLGNDGKFPIMLPMTCYEGSYHYPYPGASALGESIVRAVDKGAVASWSPTGLGVATGHDVMNRAFFDAIFQAEVPTLGLATMAGLQQLAATGSNLDLLDTYVLFGDPALQVQSAPTSITLQFFAASEESDRSVIARWATGPGTDLLGFNLYRTSGEHEQRVNPEIIASRGPASAGGAAYEYRDGPLAPGEYAYWLESIDLHGEALDRYGPVQVVVAGSRLYLPLIQR